MRKPFLALAVCSPLLLSGVAKADFNTTYQDVVKAAGGNSTYAHTYCSFTLL